MGERAKELFAHEKERIAHGRSLNKSDRAKSFAIRFWAEKREKQWKSVKTAKERIPNPDIVRVFLSSQADRKEYSTKPVLLNSGLSGSRFWTNLKLLEKCKDISYRIWTKRGSIWSLDSTLSAYVNICLSRNLVNSWSDSVYQHYFMHRQAKNCTTSKNVSFAGKDYGRGGYYRVVNTTCKLYVGVK